MIDSVTGILLGSLAAGGHLWLTRLRARLHVSAQTGRALALLPLALLLPVALVLLSMKLSHMAGWAAAASLIVTHRVAIWRQAR